MFYVDIEADVEDKAFDPILAEIEAYTDTLKILGVY